MTRNYITFDNDHVQDILDGKKYETVRYGWEQYPTPGDLIDLRDGYGNVFAEAEVADVREETINYFVTHDHHGHRDYEDVDEMVEHMNKYYSEDMDRSTIITVITFDVKHHE